MKYLKPSQILCRIVKLIRSKKFSHQIYPTKTYKLNKLFNPHNLIIIKNPFKCIKNAENLLKNCFIFLNQEVEFCEGINWNDTELSKTWNFNLNYFEYVLDLGIAYYNTGERKYFRKFKELVESWIKENNIVKEDSWHPYPTSRRIVNWIMAFSLFFKEINEKLEFYSIFFKSLYFQISYLSKNLEYDVMANHLISNAKALLFGGAFFKEEKWYKKGIKILMEQLNKQILPDGGHFERSPMYHCIVLTDILDCLSLIPKSGRDFMFIEEKAEKMLIFLDSIILPNGKIPLFSDSSLNMALPAERIFSYANKLGIKWKDKSKKENLVRLKDSGYYIIKDKGSFMIIDGGRIGAEYQPGHGHCDIFSYEFLLGKEKIITDSGNYEYQRSDMRKYCRSTRAHNTIMINNKEQSEIWDSFRVARRANPENISLTKKDKLTIFSGCYSPATQIDLKHTRFIIFLKDNFYIVLDKIESMRKNIKKHRIENFIHLHPQIQIKNSSEDKLLLKSRNNREITILPFNSNIAIGKGWYCPEFGKKIRNPVISLITEEKLHVCTGYIIKPGNVNKYRINCEFQREGSLQIKIENTKFNIKFNQ
jgi:uncharacterized heparinase superfamily protein